MWRVTIRPESIGGCAGAGEASKQSAKSVFRMAMKVPKSRSFAPAALRMAGAVLLSERAERARSEGSALPSGPKVHGKLDRHAHVPRAHPSRPELRLRHEVPRGLIAPRVPALAVLAARPATGPRTRR